MPHHKWHRSTQGASSDAWSESVSKYWRFSPPIIQNWLKEATNHAELLPVNKDLAETALYQLQVTTKSPMGALVYGSGGLLIDNGWLRIAGSGHPRLPRDPASWTQRPEFASVRALPIADDVAGEFLLLMVAILGRYWLRLLFCARYAELGKSGGWIFWVSSVGIIRWFRYLLWKCTLVAMARRRNKIIGNGSLHFLPFLMGTMWRSKNKKSYFAYWTLGNAVSNERNNHAIRHVQVRVSFPDSLF